MSDASPDPTPSDDGRADGAAASPLVRQGGAAVALIAVVALLFWGIGSLTGDDDGVPVVADDPDATEVDGADADGDATDPPPDLPADDATDGATEADGDDADAGDADSGDADGEGADGEDADGEDADDGDDADGGEVERTVEPGDVTVQVLDGVKTDGGSAADEVAGLLGDEGYDIVARNDALDYDVTTVLYNPGNEDAAQQIAAELGGAEVREQPGTLSTAVDLHVVVGSDRA